MSTAPRRILIDDADSAIQYGPGWAAADTSKLDGLGNYGPVYAGTSHATATDGSTLSFKFSGTSVAVFGTIDIANTNGVVTPTWTCLVDGNNWNLCAQSQLSTGAHTLTINVQTTGSTFYIDYLLYTPTADVDLDVAILEYPNTDASVTFQSSWQEWGGQNVTQSKGASVTLNFHGTAVTLIGYIPIELPKNSTGASYAIDGGGSTSFTLAGLAQGVTTTVYTVPVLQITGLSPAAHQLVVTYNGDSSHTPLPVGLFYVTNAVVTAAPESPPPPPPPSSTSTSFHTSTFTTTFTSGGAVFTTTSVSVSASPIQVASVNPTGAAFSPSFLSSFSTSPSSSSSSSPGSDLTPDLSATSKKPPLGAIIGAIAGGLVLIALLVGGILWCRKRRRHISTPRSDPSVLNPFLASEGELHTDSTKGSSISGPGTFSRYTRPSTSQAGDATAIMTQHSHAAPSSSRGSTRRTASPYGSLSPPSSSFGDGDGERAASLAPQRRPRPVVFQQTIDSGVRIPARATESLLEPEIVELPPGYSRD
ncbi:hypothetical protein K438DRAFT_1827413 [Mycena galopus ATCC 62051]|nr:hypothetical protein K438DRAFT_1827413 [Mycena galopus ATCC 62051]